MHSFFFLVLMLLLVYVSGTMPAHAYFFLCAHAVFSPLNPLNVTHLASSCIVRLMIYLIPLPAASLFYMLMKTTYGEY